MKDEKDGGLDLMVALGAPEGGPKDKAKEPEAAYLDSKDPELVMHLMDAVDETRSPEQRAEALCRAIESSAAAKPLASPEPPRGDEDYPAEF